MLKIASAFLVFLFCGLADYSLAATPCIKHTFVSGKPDSPDATVISSSEWNECHTVDDAGIPVAKIDTTGVKKTAWFGAGGCETDGTEAAAPARVVINSGAPRWTIITTDNDAASIYCETSMPKEWDGGTITVAHHYIQTAANTGALNGDVAAACRMAGATINNTLGTEVAIDDAAVTGSNALDITTSGIVTPTGPARRDQRDYCKFAISSTRQGRPLLSPRCTILDSRSNTALPRYHDAKPHTMDCAGSAPAADALRAGGDSARAACHGRGKSRLAGPHDR